MLKQIRKKSEVTNKNLEKLIKYFDMNFLTDDLNSLSTRISLFSFIEHLKQSTFFCLFFC